MKLWNRHLGLLLVSLTILVCCATVLIAFMSHRKHFSRDGGTGSDSAAYETIKPVGPLLSAAFDTIRSGASLAAYHIPESAEDNKEDQDANENRDESAFHMALAEHEELPLRSPHQAFMQEKRLEAAIGNYMAQDAFLLVDKNPQPFDFEPEEGRTGKGEGVQSVLLGLQAANAEEYARAAKTVPAAGALRQGQPWRAFISPETGRIARFEYEIDDSRLLVLEGDEKPSARLARLDYDVVLERIEGVVEDNLFNAIAALGENPQLAASFARLFGPEINFSRKLQSGDVFTVLVEKKHRNGEFRNYGRILAARFINRGRLHEAFLFRDDAGRAQYFNGKGENLRKTILQAPVAGRATSRFSESRLHPILNIVRPHHGVDYGAPHGTPVKAAGDGVVKERGWVGGYGNTVVIQHDGGLESLYAHLSGYAPGLHPGQKMRQGQLIGFVGSTGLATGPHLDFRLRKNGEFIDPEKFVGSRAAPVSPGLKKEFEKTLAIERACLDGERKIENYSPDSIIAPVLASFEESRVAEAQKLQRESRQERFRRKLLERKAALRNAFLKQKKLMHSSSRKPLKSVNSLSKPEGRGSERAASARKSKNRS